MLYHLFSKVFSRQLVIMGWNFVKFDWTYLVKRAGRLGIDAEICAEDNKLDVKTLLPKHKLVLDLMEMFNKWSKWGIDLQNSSLDEVSHKVLGVVKVKDRQTLIEQAEQIFQHSALILAQAFMPTDYDWRIGVLNRQPIFACGYFMSRGHWQIYQHHQTSKKKRHYEN